VALRQNGTCLRAENENLKLPRQIQETKTSELSFGTCFTPRAKLV
jgi:hypothetical protein